MFRTLVFHEIRPQNELNGQQRPIIVHDGYQDALPLPLFDSLPLFEERINYLVEKNYHLLTLTELKAFYQQQTPLPEKSVLLTFDDCFQSLKEYAYPVLKAAGVKASVFVATGWLFPKPAAYQADVSKVLSPEDLTAMAEVFEYANHTAHFHQRRGTTAAKSMWKTPADFKADVALANQAEIIQHKDVFAYPFGLYDQQTVTSLEEMAFKLAFTTKPGYNTAATNPLELQRDVIPAAMSLATFKELMAAPAD
ncbi:polysaccharide deacetylase family protein [Enterococcus sp. LJL90]